MRFRSGSWRPYCLKTARCITPIWYDPTDGISASPSPVITIGSSEPDMISKTILSPLLMAIAQKEADESCYWLELLNRTNYLESNQFQSLHEDADELLKIIRTIIMNTKKNIEK